LHPNAERAEQGDAGVRETVQVRLDLSGRSVDGVQVRAGLGTRFNAPVMQEIRTHGAGALLTVREVAARLRVCTATVYNLCASGRLPYVRLASHSISVLEDDLTEHTRGARVPQDP
jgi:excisionase family DNA binding protein